MRACFLVALLTATLHLYGLGCPYFTIGGGVAIPSRNSSTKEDSFPVLFGPTVPGTSLFSLPDVEWKNKYETGFELFALAGIPFTCHWRTDLEFLYQQMNRKISGFYSWQEVNAATIALFAESFNNPLRRTTATTHLFCLMPNLYYDIFICRCWNAYLGAGVGNAWLRSSSTVRDGILTIDIMSPPLVESASTIEQSPRLGGTAFAWQAKAGVNYKFRCNLLVGLSYRFLGTTRFMAKGSRITTNPGTSGAAAFRITRKNIRGFLNHSINLSLTYKI